MLVAHFWYHSTFLGVTTWTYLLNKMIKIVGDKMKVENSVGELKEKWSVTHLKSCFEWPKEDDTRICL